ncbi:hypothetical protein PR202_gb10312 [Eleusine coracana subsp. coracana]|uniref:Uncharacterized protein n=1 Tax=Eleusine coracana subsp. coracana TaxID=191504 RepID=A0AAV5EK22_ELECO|nr:hypothetical protein PR202_gb10312 [Eleusine coracana subsp. coracana]
MRENRAERRESRAEQSTPRRSRARLVMAQDESFKRPGSIPFKWEVQPGIPKQESVAGDRRTTTATATAALPPMTPRLAPPPAARVCKLASASCRRSSDASAAKLLSPPPTPPASSHRRSMSARFAESLVLPFTRRPRRSRAKDDAEFCRLYAEKIA